MFTAQSVRDHDDFVAFIGLLSTLAMPHAARGAANPLPAWQTSAWCQLSNATAQAAAGVRSGPAASFADPFICVDPAFPGAANYEVIVANGVGNTPLPGPDPARAALAGSGPLLVVAAGRRPRSVAR